MKWVLLGLLLATQPAWGEVVPRPGPGDPHIQQVYYDSDQLVSLEVASGYALTIELLPDERVENIAIGDSSAWQVQVNHRGDRLFLKSLTSSVSTNLTVLTDTRRYSFLLRPSGGDGGIAPYVVKFIYAPPPPSGPVAPIQLTRYRLHGTKTLWPTAMSDDGQSTTIMWPADQKLPAIYRVDERGSEALVNGLVRDGAFVVEGVASKYIFRLGKDEANATRNLPRKRKQ